MTTSFALAETKLDVELTQMKIKADRRAKVAELLAPTFNHFVVKAAKMSEVENGRIVISVATKDSSFGVPARVLLAIAEALGERPSWMFVDELQPCESHEVRIWPLPERPEAAFPQVETKPERPAEPRAAVSSIHFKGPVIGILGKAGAGKDTIFNIIQKHRARAERVSFADPIREICRQLYDFSDEQLFGSKKDEPDLRYPRMSRVHRFECDEQQRNPQERCADCGQMIAVAGEVDPPCIHIKDFLTPREAMQTLGTEWARERYEQTWLSILARKINKAFEFGEAQRPRVAHTFAPNWYKPQPAQLCVITDVRFFDEVEALSRAGADIIRVVRPSSRVNGQRAQHATEKQDDPRIEDYLVSTIQNNGTLEDLEKQVLDLLSILGL
jgi:hypothetical protein